MKEKRKADPFGALGVTLGLLVSLSCVVFLLFGLSRCSGDLRTVETRSGFDEWDPADSRLDGELYRIVRKNTLTEYPYADGDYRVERKESGNLLISGVSRHRSLVWLTYDDPAVYEAAKQSCFDAATSTKLYPFEDPDVYGFRFYYVGENATFPANFSVFGYNDEKRTLVFVGATRDRWEKEDPDVAAGLSDFAGFLDRFFGDWFDWEAGDRAPD